MACEAINDILVREAGRFPGEIYDRLFPRSPIVSLIKRKPFPLGVGISQNVLTYERSAPLDCSSDWTAMTVTDGALGGSCLPTPVKIPVGSTTRSYTLKRRALEGPDFCLTDIMYDFQLRDQLDKIIGILTEYSMLEWEFRYRHDYVNLVRNKSVMTSTGLVTSTSGSFPAVFSDSLLTQGALNQIKARLIRDGAAASAMGMENGSAILTLLTDMETSDRIIFDNDDIRTDLRYGKPSLLLEPFGVNKSYRGFYHLMDMFPIHLTVVGGAYVEVCPFVAVAATKGNKSEINPNYEDPTVSTHMISEIFDPEVMHSLIPAPDSNPHPDFRFDPVRFLGDWKWLNIQSRDCNPDKTIGYHRGLLAHSPKPVHPERGWAIIHKRCQAALEPITSC